MRRNPLTLLLLCVAATAATTATALAETRTMTLREAVEAALRQNPDIALARLDEQKAKFGTRAAKDPFAPRVYAGSGIGYNWGIPQSVEGATPSIAQVRGSMAVYNRPQSFRAASARESERGAQVETGRQQDEVSYRTASLFLSAEHTMRAMEQQQKQIESLEKVKAAIDVRVKEGRELAIEEKKAALAVAKAKHRFTEMASDLEVLESDLAMVIGLNPDDRVKPALEDRTALPMPATEAEGVTAALAASKEIKALESKMQAKSLEVRSYMAERYPKIDLLTSYALLAKFNNYEDFFRKFQRHNTQIGLSISIPVIVPPAARAYAAQADVEVTRLRTQINQLRHKVTTDIREAYQAVHKAESARDVAKLDLEVARDQVSILMARYEEGRAPLRELEEGRMAEAEKWVAYLGAQSTVERARLDLLRHTGTLAAALK
jgi:outer membrane protein